MTETSESAQARYVPPGTAEVILTLAGGAVEAVRIRSDGRARAVAALERGTADAAPALARLLFPVCGIAHEVALSHAIIAASEHSEPVPTADRSAGQVLAEAAVAHVWRAAIDWPAALNRPAHMEAAKRARAALDGYLHADGTTEDACETLAGLLGEPALFGDGPGSIASHLRAALGPLRHAGLDPAVPPRDAGAIGALADQSEPPEREPLPLPPDACLDDRIDAVLRRVADTRAALAGEAPVPPIETRQCGAGTATAVCQTARGPLAYTVCLRDERIARLDLIAPTDLVLAPGGALARALAGIETPDATTRARAVIAAFDPCGGLRLSTREVANA